MSDLFRRHPGHVPAEPVPGRGSARRQVLLAAGGLLVARGAFAQGASSGAATPAPAGNPAPVAPGTPAAGASPAANDPRFAERGIGREDAPVKVLEFFSLTCTHCAHFALATLPQVKKELVDTGKIRLVWRDFPLDGLALAAAVTARSLPPERYESFVSALFQTQDRWAFTRNPQDPLAGLAQMAALAGMNRAQFDAAQNDQRLRQAVGASRLEGEQKYKVEATPSFVFGGHTESGDMSFDRFAELVKQAS